MGSEVGWSEELCSTEIGKIDSCGVCAVGWSGESWPVEKGNTERVLCGV